MSYAPDAITTLRATRVTAGPADGCDVTVNPPSARRATVVAASPKCTSRPAASATLR